VVLIVILFIGLCKLFFTEGIDQIRVTADPIGCCKKKQQAPRPLARPQTESVVERKLSSLWGYRLPDLRMILWSGA
jgi:hypothetical protein